jgi:hypothetical protein
MTREEVHADGNDASVPHGRHRSNPDDSDWDEDTGSGGRHSHREVTEPDPAGHGAHWDNPEPWGREQWDQSLDQRQRQHDELVEQLWGTPQERQDDAGEIEWGDEQGTWDHDPWAEDRSAQPTWSPLPDAVEEPPTEVIHQPRNAYPVEEPAAVDPTWQVEFEPRYPRDRHPEPDEPDKPQRRAGVPLMVAAAVSIVLLLTTLWLRWPRSEPHAAAKRPDVAVTEAGQGNQPGADLLPSLTTGPEPGVTPAPGVSTPTRTPTPTSTRTSSRPAPPPPPPPPSSSSPAASPSSPSPSPSSPAPSSPPA